jgi:hypothetical protein
VYFVECDRVRDRFSAFLEKELEPSEETELKKHLASCPACQEDLKRFSKSLDWLHGVGEVETPEGFLSELREKIENQKIRISRDKPVRAKGFPFWQSFRLPIQAAAMVVIVFLSIYLTKMTPREEFAPRVAMDRKAPTSAVEEKKDQILASKETGRENTLQEAPGKKEEKPLESYANQAESPQPVLSEGEKTEKSDVHKALKKKEETERSDKEMILKSTNLEETFSHVRELTHRFGGEVSKTEGNVILASLPAASFPEFERAVRGFTSPSGETGARLQKERAGGVSVVPGPMGFRAQEKSEMGPGGGMETEERLIVRILLVKE